MTEPHNDALTDYLNFARERPTLFENPGDEGISILLDPAAIRDVERVMADRLAAKGLPREWSRIGFAYRDQYLTVLRDAVRFPDGSLGTYIRSIEPQDAARDVAILPRWQGRFVLVRHFRHATRRWHLEIPRGYGEMGLSDEENARRELDEEIGATASSLVRLGTVAPNTGLHAGEVALFLAELSSLGEADRAEGISDIVTYSRPEFEQLMCDNTITDGFALAAYARASIGGLLGPG